MVLRGVIKDLAYKDIKIDFLLTSAVCKPVHREEAIIFNEFIRFNRWTEVIQHSFCFLWMHYYLLHGRVLGGSFPFPSYKTKLFLM